MWKKVKDKIETYDLFLTEKVLQIYGRQDLTTGILLTYCSPLRFSFQNQLLPRGWVDCLIFGDSRCGKTDIAKGILNGVQMGEFFSCENASFAGLIGGLQQVSGRTKWDIVWGKLPLNTGRLLIADEMSNLEVDEISSMSSVRSSGIAEICKVQSGMTKAQTRMVWLSNPRDGSKMSEYTYGMLALKGIIGRMEDIARFDFAIAVNTDDVPLNVLNAMQKSDNARDEFGWEPLKHLIRWVWNLHPSEILFPDDTTQTILDLSIQMARDYTSTIPLVEPNEQRIKIARISAAVAARCYSEENHNLVVKPEHALYANHFMRRCFDSKALGYRMMSRAMAEDDEANIKNKDVVVSVLRRYGAEKNPRSLKLMYNTELITLNDIGNIFNITSAESREILSVLMRCGCLTKTIHSNYKKTTFGIKIIEELMMA